ncbi:hypothetical protein [Nocardioides jishulii]|uniref:Uncharacterized protein n=1 Tax=Nocardioides jishulii TaxID=2575440 RepID=A0A4U2YRE7_9ACTN|nr:hypothetical protein [Nocardioides jishulii]QCX27735.1 hypothetical protein FCL41_09500 [Nocardioides jishulii]TKI62541.1 hypothetical protein FC770_09165 [Nocardioides jishulii]
MNPDQRHPASPDSPSAALGAETDGLRHLLVETIEARHTLAADAHLVSESRYGMGFGSQWRDLLDDTREALTDRGFESCRLAPGGHSIPVVNNCLVYVWRVPNHPDAVNEFASSPTRKSGFAVPPPEPGLWEPSLSDEHDAADNQNEGEVEQALRAVDDAMSVILVMIKSSPWRLHSVDWAVAVLDEDGKVELRGTEPIWVPEPDADASTSEVESFDSGAPIEPTVEAREQEETDPDA